MGPRGEVVATLTVGFPSEIQASPRVLKREKVESGPYCLDWEDQGLEGYPRSVNFSGTILRELERGRVSSSLLSFVKRLL